MQKTFTILSLVAVIVLLTACNAPGSPAAASTPTADLVATQVALMLTQMPTVTHQPSTATQAPSPTPPSATSTPTETSSPTPTSTDTPEPTPSNSDPKVYLGQPVWQTTFDSGKAFGVIDNENTRIRQENGALQLTGVNANGWLGWSVTFSRQPLDFYIDATFTTQTCSGADQYGLIFRAPDTNAGYFFGVTCSGQYYFESNDFKENGVQTRIIQATSDPHLLPGSNQTNRLGVMAKGDQISLYANGVLLQTVTDTSFAEKGYFGAFVAAYQTAGFTVSMEDIALWDLP